ncbi:MAG: hypothetical protein ACRCZS_25920 [Chroococcidiopsis sp.]
MTEKANLQIERLRERTSQELLLIASGAIFSFISSQILPISDVAIAVELNISVPLVRQAIAELERDQLVVQTYQGDWECAF